jgi:hypothetical protein
MPAPCATRSPPPLSAGCGRRGWGAAALSADVRTISRVHGPTVLVEYDHTQNGANHDALCLVDPDAAFGRDLL